MIADPNRPTALVAVATEAEADAIVTDLAEYGIEALFTGGYISGFKAAAPATVTVQVKSADLERAQQALSEIRESSRHIDWSAVDFSPATEGPTEAEPAATVATDWSPHIDRAILTLFVVGAAASLLIPLFTGEGRSAFHGTWMIVVIINAVALLLLAWRMLLRPR